jgi:hypothetical protein
MQPAVNGLAFDETAYKVADTSTPIGQRSHVFGTTLSGEFLQNLDPAMKRSLQVKESAGVCWILLVRDWSEPVYKDERILRKRRRSIAILDCY